MMIELILAYAFAAGMGVAVIYLARENRKQGWQRPAPRWFGVELQNRDLAMDAPQDPASLPDELLPQLLQLNRALAAHGSTTSPVVQLPAVPELVSSRRV